LAELPEPKSEWSKEEQADWLDALAGFFRVVYKSKGGGSIRVTFEPKAAQ
jgi:nitrous oxide reductase accessory protein NosL